MHGWETCLAVRDHAGQVGNGGASLLGMLLSAANTSGKGNRYEAEGLNDSHCDRIS